ncbi:MAG: ABC transporter permease subunit [Bacteroidales bacterium]|jgi:phosphate transport system permease protein|nr:ABC transporter permease subunit [Bacteroidales bacterium]
MRHIKYTEQAFFKFLTGFACYSVIGILCLIISIIFIKGVGSLSWEMISQAPKGGYYYGGDGGVLNAILGSLYVAGGAVLIAIVLGAPAALFINSFLFRYKRLQNIIRYFLDALWGIPSIVYGAFGFTIMLYFGMNASLLAGIITVACLITPIMIRSFDEVLSTIPTGLHEAALSLGSTRTELAFKVIFKQGLPGFVTAILLAFGRGIGDAASVLFTAGYTDQLPSGLHEPAATLPLAIFFQLSSPIPEVRGRAYSAAAILTCIILAITLISRLLVNKYSKNNLK